MMNHRTAAFLATLISSTFGMVLFVILIAVSAIRGWGKFGDPEPWENSPEDDFLAQQDAYYRRRNDPELYENSNYAGLEDYEGAYDD